MYQLMIVDDEEPVLDSFSFILSKDVTDFVICGKARSGAEALRLIPELTPDLVFMDIQMPGIDGLEVIKQIRPQFPNIVFILATAYERFDIAQKAIPLGVFGYLVKPVSKKNLLDELAKAKIYLDQTRDRNKIRLEEIQLLKKTKEDEKNIFLKSLIWRNLDNAEWDRFMQLFNINCDRGALYIIESVGDISEDLKISLYELITNKITYKYKCLSTLIAGRMLLFFPEEQSLSHLDIHLQRIIDKIGTYTFIIGKGGTYPLSSLHSSYSEAFKVFAAAESKEKSYSAGRERLQEVCDNILAMENMETNSLFEEYWIEIFNKYSFSVAKGKMVVLFSRLLSKLDTHLLTAMDINIDPAEEIMILNSVEEWRQWASHILKRLEKIKEINSRQSYPRALVTALAFVKENYQKPLQLSLVADRNGVSNSYLSRLFKEYLGINFVDYLNQLRLKKAIILLEGKKYSIKEIAYLVGYQDPNYFSRIFRRQMGFSPSDLDKGVIKNEI